MILTRPEARIISRAWIPCPGSTSSRCSSGGHVSTPSKVERIKSISFMTRGKFEIGSSKMKRESQEPLQGSQLPSPSASFLSGLLQFNWGGIPSTKQGSWPLSLQHGPGQRQFLEVAAVGRPLGNSIEVVLVPW